MRLGTAKTLLTLVLEADNLNGALLLRLVLLNDLLDQIRQGKLVNFHPMWRLWDFATIVIVRHSADRFPFSF